jgi:hypothetical protein
MNLLVWRLHRTQVLFAGAALAVLAVVLLVTGITMAHDYRQFLAHCAATQSCANGQDQLFRGDAAIKDVVNATLIVPLLFGLFWGAPLVAKDIEDGTHNLVWTQGVSRRHWLGTNLMWALLGAAVWGGAMAVLVSWWRFPENALDSRFSAFDIQGIAPVAYSLFAVALGIAVGSIVRRVLPAIATTLGIFVGLRAAIAVYVRPHYLAPVSQLFPLAGPRSSLPGGSWLLSSGIAGPGGQAYGDSLSLNDVPAACRGGPLGLKGDGGLPCLASHGFHQLLTYQPAGRFWIFQGIEAAVFVVLAVALVAVAYRRVLSRDA